MRRMIFLMTWCAHRSKLAQASHSVMHCLMRPIEECSAMIDYSDFTIDELTEAVKSAEIEAASYRKQVVWALNERARKVILADVATAEQAIADIQAEMTKRAGR